MRDYLENLNDFNLSVEKSIKQMVLFNDQNLRKQVLDNSNFHWESQQFFNLKRINLIDSIRLSILVWYLPEEISYILRLDLEENLRKFSLEDQFLLKQFLSSKAEMLLFLQETRLWHTREFFGNVLNRNYKLDRYFKIFFLKQKIKRTQRKRGYQDHGSRVPDHKKKPKFDWSFTEEQNDLEFKKQTHDETVLFSKGWLS